jgi:outer membrane murein-binding lipoprotein Lpp
MSFDVQDLARKQTKLDQKVNGLNTKFETLQTKYDKLFQAFDALRASLPAKPVIDNTKLKAADIRKLLSKCYGNPTVAEQPLAKTLGIGAIRETLQIKAGASISSSDLAVQLKALKYPPIGRNSFLVLPKA